MARNAQLAILLALDLVHAAIRALAQRLRERVESSGSGWGGGLYLEPESQRRSARATCTEHVRGTAPRTRAPIARGNELRDSPRSATHGYELKRTCKTIKSEEDDLGASILIVHAYLLCPPPSPTPGGAFTCLPSLS